MFDLLYKPKVVFKKELVGILPDYILEETAKAFTIRHVLNEDSKEKLLLMIKELQELALGCYFKSSLSSKLDPKNIEIFNKELKCRDPRETIYTTAKVVDYILRKLHSPVIVRLDKKPALEGLIDSFIVDSLWRDQERLYLLTSHNLVKPKLRKLVEELNSGPHTLYASQYTLSKGFPNELLQQVYLSRIDKTLFSLVLDYYAGGTLENFWEETMVCLRFPLKRAVVVYEEDAVKKVLTLERIVI